MTTAVRKHPRRVRTERAKPGGPSLKDLLLADSPRGPLGIPDRRRAGPYAVDAHYDRRQQRIVVQLNTGLLVVFAPGAVDGLQDARPRDLGEIEINPSGFGLHFPKIDADIYLPDLLAGHLGSRRWMAAQLGQRGGAERSAIKAAAARANGKLGGRPLKREAV